MTTRIQQMKTLNIAKAKIDTRINALRRLSDSLRPKEALLVAAEVDAIHDDHLLTITTMRLDPDNIFAAGPSMRYVGFCSCRNYFHHNPKEASEFIAIVSTNNRSDLLDDHYAHVRKVARKNLGA